jgi:hypothetical protein
VHALIKIILQGQPGDPQIILAEPGIGYRIAQD